MFYIYLSLNSGNPLRCDCNIRPFTHFYQSQLNAPKSFKDIICHSPDALANKPLHEIFDDNLNCNNATKYANSETDVVSDLNFGKIVL